MTHTIFLLRVKAQVSKLVNIYIYRSYLFTDTLKETIKNTEQYLLPFILDEIIVVYFILFYIEFQPMTYVSDNSYLLSNQDTS